MKDLSLERFSIEAASSAPVPGGGGVSGAVGSLAASLAEMVANLTIGKKKYLEYTDEFETIIKKLEELRIALLNSINEDAEAFKPLAEVYSLPKDSEGYEQKMESCLRTAATSPMNILKLTSKIIDIDERLAVIGSKISVSDAATSIMLAHGVLYGAYVNIIVNTSLMKDKEYAEKFENEAKTILDDYSKKALNIYNQILQRLKG